MGPERIYEGHCGGLDTKWGRRFGFEVREMRIDFILANSIKMPTWSYILRARCYILRLLFVECWFRLLRGSARTALLLLNKQGSLLGKNAACAIQVDSGAYMHCSANLFYLLACGGRTGRGAERRSREKDEISPMI